MSKSILDHTLSSDAHVPSSPPGTTDRATHLLDDDKDDASERNFSHFAFDPPNTFGAANSDYHCTFDHAGPNLVLYSSDLNIPPVHGAPEIVMAAGSSPGSSHGGTSSSGGSALVTGAASTGLIINVAYDQSVSSLPAGFTNAVAQVVQYFESHFTDPVTININVGYGEAGGYLLNGALGMSLTYLQSVSYSQIKSALGADAKSAADSSSVASLPVSDPTGGNYWVSTAEAKALGLITSTTNVDGYVGFSNTAGIFDYNNADGVASGQYDFFGVVAHEFSEVMGRMLLVGATIGSISNSYDPLDLFHYSAKGVHDFSGSTPGYFSADNGTTSLNTFNTVSGGDAGDWKGATIDAYNAFGTPGVVEPISPSDLTAMDVIGWDTGVAPPPPPPPPTQADLTVSNLALSISPASTAVSFHINDIGTASAAASTAGVYLSTDSTITTSDTLLATISTPSLSAGTFVTENISLTLSAPTTAGTYYIGVIADSGNVVAESNESNNASNASLSSSATTAATSDRQIRRNEHDFWLQRQRYADRQRRRRHADRRHRR